MLLSMVTALKKRNNIVSLIKKGILIMILESLFYYKSNTEVRLERIRSLRRIQKASVK